MLIHLIILSVTTVSLTYATVKVKQGLHVRRSRDDLQTNKYPYFAYVNINNNSCGGAILSDSWVITAKACGNTTAQEPGWVYAGDHSVQKRRIAQQHSCPDEHRLLLLQLEQPLTFDGAVSAIPIPRPGSFSGNEGTCEVLTFGDAPSESGLNTVHAVKARLAGGSDCARSASEASTVVQSSSTASPSPDSARGGTTSTTTPTTSSQTHSTIVTDSSVAFGDGSKKKKRDLHNLEAASPELFGTDLLCSSGIMWDANGLNHLGSPMVCQGMLVALVTPKPSHGASKEEKDSKTYYTAIYPDYSWIMEKVPGVQVESWGETAKEGRSVLPRSLSSGLIGQTALHKYKTHLSNARRRRLSQLVNLITDAEPGIAEATKHELDDELEPHFKLNKIFSVWFPLVRRVRGIVLLNRMYVRPQSELWGEPLEKAEAALRPLRRVKRSSQQLIGKGADGDTRAAPTTTRLAQRLANRDEPSGVARWRDRYRYTATAD